MRLVVHIGLHKTGSTSIQKALNGEHARLAAEGIHVPRSATGGFSRGAHNIAWQLEGHRRFDPAGGTLEALAAELAEVGAATAVISAEGLEREDPSGEKYRRLAALAHGCGRELVVVGYVREYAAALNSKYCEGVKGLAHAMTFADFLARMTLSGRPSYGEVFAPYEAVADRVVVRPYGADVVADFFAQLGAPAPANPPPRLNESIGPATVEACRVLRAHYLAVLPLDDTAGKEVFPAVAIRAAAAELGWNATRFWGFAAGEAHAAHARLVARDLAFLERHALTFDAAALDRPRNERLVGEMEAAEREEFFRGLGSIVHAVGATGARSRRAGGRREGGERKAGKEERRSRKAARRQRELTGAGE